MEWFLKALRKYADFSGRAQRKEFWMFFLFYYIFMTVMSFIDTIISKATDLSDPAPLFTGLYFLIMFLPLLSCAVRRAHDTGKNGWWLLIGWWILMLINGQEGDNKYGSNPKTSPQKQDEKTRLTNVTVFFDALRKYADFSGRAQRKEFWMFVLFYYLFMISALFIDGIISVTAHSQNDIPVLMLAYALAMILPFLAIVVRRAHDTGKSGWWILIGAPLIIMEKGQDGDNKYGTNPKTSPPQKPDEKARLRNAAVAVIVAASCSLLFVVAIIIDRTHNAPLKHMVDNITGIILNLLFLFIGILLFQDDYGLTVERARRKISVLLIIYGAVMTLASVLSLAFLLDPGNIAALLQNLALLFFAVALATSDRMLLRTASIVLITVTGIVITVKIILAQILANEHSDNMIVFNVIFLTQIALMLLAGAFMPDKTEIAANSYNGQGYTGQNYPGQGYSGQGYSGQGYYGGDTSGTPAGAVWQQPAVRQPATLGDSPAEVKFVREDCDDTSVWQVYSAPNKSAALAFLSEQTVTRSLFYVVVETPEGNFGKDKDGIYRES